MLSHTPIRYWLLALALVATLTLGLGLVGVSAEAESDTRPGVIIATNVCVQYFDGYIFNGAEVRPPAVARYRWVGTPGDPGDPGDPYSPGPAFLWLPGHDVIRAENLWIGAAPPLPIHCGFLFQPTLC